MAADGRRQSEVGAAGGEPQGVSDTTIVHLVYGLQMASFFVGITAIVGVILNYVRRDRVAGTWLESHFTWQIRTFWYALLWTLVGIATLFILVGYLILLGVFLWSIYRVAKGWLNLADGWPMYAEPG
ncbi:MAG: hypothetical protein U9Q81_11935 [Pseudomonadota bacterium]|nr:hypothetical protein [Pseudomonadota bacterium]